MPHCIIEYSAKLADELSISQLTDTVHEAALSSGLFSSEDIKSRSYPCDHYRTGNDRNSFVHVVIKILPGRESEVRKQLSQNVLAAVSDFATAANTVTVEVVDLDSSYSKVTR